MKKNIDNNIDDRSSTFIDNMSLPIHRWFRYTAGFSAPWVEEEIISFSQRQKKPIESLNILDPFAGSGTTLLAAEKIGAKAFGFESHPFISRVAEAKLLWRTDASIFRDFATTILEKAKTYSLDSSIDSFPEIVYKCYPPETLSKLSAIKKVLFSSTELFPEYKLTWLVFISILRHVSDVGTAQWQYVLPNKKKQKKVDVWEVFEKKIDIVYQDILSMAKYSEHPYAELFAHDSREEFNSLKNTIDIIITSPPYANNYDYADATRLEQSVLGEISGWGDLQDTVRPFLVRSCSQHVSKLKKQTFELIKHPILSPIYAELFDVCEKLDKEKELHGGKKNYHTMIASYFLDMAHVWKNLRTLCKDGAEVCFVIGDSAPYGIYVPVERWFGELALSYGFEEFRFEKLRDRNVKWKNRKHTVPLKEGRLWVKG